MTHPQGPHRRGAPSSRDPRPGRPTRSSRRAAAWTRTAPSAWARASALALALGLAAAPGSAASAATPRPTPSPNGLVGAHRAAQAARTARAAAVSRGRARTAVVLPHLIASRAALVPAIMRTPAALSARTARAFGPALPSLASFAWKPPVAGTHMTSGFGRRWGRLHAGVDFAGAVGTPLHALSTGVVTFAGQQPGYGNIVEIRYWDGMLVKYGHMNSIATRVGHTVRPGQIVGALGDTGHSTGPHLHLQIQPQGTDDTPPVDPVPWLIQRGILPPDATDAGEAPRD